MNFRWYRTRGVRKGGKDGALDFQYGCDQEVMYVAVIHPGDVWRYRQWVGCFQSEDVRSGTTFVCDCKGELMGVAPELKDVSSWQRGKKRVGFGKESRISPGSECDKGYASRGKG